MKSKRDKRNYIIIGLCALLVVMGVGYAAFSSLLTINGTANITNSWCVGFDNTKQNTYTAKAGITGATAPTGSITFSGSTCVTKYQPDASLTATFHQPGDQIEYTLTIKNKSTVPVAIKSIQVENNSVTTDTTIKKGNIEFIVHMPESTNLAVDGETTMKVVARFQNTTDVTGPYNGEEQKLNVKINAEQGTGTDGMETTYTGTIYRHNTNTVYNGINIKKGYVYANSAGSMGPSDFFGSMEECLAKYSNQSEYYCQNAGNALGNYTENSSTINKDYYLRHDVVEDVVVASYTCFVTDKEYCLKGTDGGESFILNKSIVERNQTWFENNGGSCSFNTYNYNCYISGGISVGANQDGSASIRGDDGISCTVSRGGFSSCI